MNRIVLTYGAIAGLIPGLMFFLAHPADGTMDFEKSEWTGWITMMVALSCIFLAVKHYRDKHLTGNIGFGKALGIGVLVSLVAGVIYVSAWEIYSATIGGGFADQYLEFVKQQLSEQGKSTELIQKEIADTEEMMTMYKTNAFFRIGMTFIEIFPVGFLVSLLTAILFTFFLRRKDV